MASSYEHCSPGDVIGHLRISLRAIRNNAQLLRDMVGPKHAAFVVKSNAYGHGLLETARAAEPLARRICVYAFEEALALREGGITKPILVLGPIPPDALDDVMAAKLDVAFGTPASSRAGSPTPHASARRARRCT